MQAQRGRLYVQARKGEGSTSKRSFIMLMQAQMGRLQTDADAARAAASANAQKLDQARAVVKTAKAQVAAAERRAEQAEQVELASDEIEEAKRKA
eukprot:1160833-Pelagomonas_calceolata.AAC.1